MRCTAASRTRRNERSERRPPRWLTKSGSSSDVSPEAAHGGPLSQVRDGDMIRLDAHAGSLQILADAAEFAGREKVRVVQPGFGYGRELFGWMRRAAAPAEQGGGALFGDAA